MDLESRYKQAIALEEVGKHAEALRLYAELIAENGDPRFLIACGVCLQNLGHWEQSAEKLARGISLKPHYGEGEARLSLAEAYMKMGNKLKAVEQWKIVAARKPEYPGYERVPNEAKEKLKTHA